MEYQALYRKYRPQRFAEVIGQDHVTHTLAREISEGRVAHAYLFAGPRGTGKTTTARILAKALNCPDREGAGEPCGRCISCTAVAGSSSMDVLELDAASHNKVEDIRDLRASVSTVASAGGAKRVFILDEAHMLTKSAGNALLKTLEEPPDHVHFVLATTEPYRLLDTIRSRSQRFDFHLVPSELIAAHLEGISRAEGYRASPEALSAVAQRAAGSVRDALSLLEQIAARDGSVTMEGIGNALGVAGPEAIETLIRALEISDAGLALELVAGLAGQGVDLRRFTGDVLAFFRGVFLTMYSPDVSNITGDSAEVVAGWEAASGRLPRSVVMRTIDLLGEALVKLREGREERVMLELAVLKLVRPELDSNSDALLSRIERLERRLTKAMERPQPMPEAAEPVPDATQPAAGGGRPPFRKAARPAPVPETPTSGPGLRGSAVPEPDPAPSKSHPMEVPEPSKDRRSPVRADPELERIWPQLVAGVRDNLGPRRTALFESAIPAGLEGSALVFEVVDHYYLTQLSSDRKLKNYLAKRAAQLLKRDTSVLFRASASADQVPASAPITSPAPTPAPERPIRQEPPMEQEPPPEAITEPSPHTEPSSDAEPSFNLDIFSLLQRELGAREVHEDERRP